MAISIVPNAAARLPVDAQFGSLVIARQQDRMCTGFMAATADRREMKSVICLAPSEQIGRPQAIGDLAVIDLGLDFSIEFEARDLGSVVSAFGWNDDIVGGILIGADGALALVMPKQQGEFRYFHMATGFVDLTRPAAANGIILAWSLSVGLAEDKRTIATIDVRAPQPAAMIG